MRHSAAKFESAKSTRKNRRCSAIAALVVAAGMSAGCNESSTNTFRTTAADYLETGLNAIADGLIAGLFAVVDQSSDTTGDQGASTDSTGG
ncbi:MAG: hypothetical protein JNG88_11260 [Phycisphaerales bacterium]|nr:hypothetical protein [Phycisphaerales bacterium]